MLGPESEKGPDLQRFLFKIHQSQRRLCEARRKRGLSQQRKQVRICEGVTQNVRTETYLSGLYSTVVIPGSIIRTVHCLLIELLELKAILFGHWILSASKWLQKEILQIFFTLSRSTCTWTDLNHAVHENFRTVSASNTFVILRPKEVKQLVCGSPTLDLPELRKVAYAAMTGTGRRTRPTCTTERYLYVGRKPAF